jgi:Asp-tRNA(Asn)/Glu-tRNA(Gln) amidotransferase A subunit family amidase
MSTESWQFGVVALAQALRSGALEPVQLLDIFLDRIKRLDPALNTMVATDVEGARVQARASAARLRRGEPLSPLDGIPITIKDNLLVRGFPATWGCKGFANHHPAQDELPVERLRAAGAVILGKTNVPELTLQGYTSNLLFGTTRNPWDTRLTPGGSSGAAAAGVAAGLAPAAIGTDGGGSIRRPACHTGLVGFKPSIGRYPRANGFPELISDFEVIGTLTHSVEDTKLLDAILAGPSQLDRRSHPPSPQTMRDTTRLRILYVPRFGDSPCDREVESAADTTAKWLADQGHDVERAPIPFDRAQVDEIWRVIGCSAVAHLLQHHGPSFEADCGPFVIDLARQGRAIAAADYVGALAKVSSFRLQMCQLFKRYDLIFTPSAAALPWPAEESHPPEIDGRPAGARGHAVYTAWVNVCGHPAISLPLGFSRSGLPIGGQFIGAYGCDDSVLAFAERFESAGSHGRKWPSFALAD